jgi:WD40 repeat protein
MASASADRTVRLWDAKTGAVQHTLNVDIVIRNLSFSASSQHLKTERRVLNISSSGCLRALFVSDKWVAIEHVG